VDTGDVIALPTIIVAWGDKWGPAFAHAAGSQCREHLRKAAADGWRVLEVNRAIYPGSDAIAQQAVVDRLQNWGVIAGLDDDEVQQIVVEAKAFAGIVGAVDDDAADIDARAPECSDEAIALELAELQSARLRYVKAWATWLVWTGTQWLLDHTLFAVDLVRRHCRKVAQRHEADSPRVAVAIASAKTVANVERLARADRRLAATVEQWDEDASLFNTPGGIVDLDAGKLGPHRPDAYMTKIAGVAPDWSCPTPMWTAFLMRVMNGDRELIAYLQRMAGYALTGVIREHKIFFLYGTGSNGKDTFLNALIGCWGDYHRTAPIEVFTATQANRHPTELAGLRGARLVTSVETEEGRRWAEAKIKALTGGGQITARFMRADFFDFYPVFKPLIAGNHKPGLRSVDEAIRRRMNLIPFTVTIPKEEQDPTLGERLKAEWPGIMAWAIDGCLEWQRHGLAPPAAVQNATESYLEAEDSLAAWIEDACEHDAQAWEGSTALYASWKTHADRTGEFAGSLKRFVQRIEERAGGLGVHKARGPNDRQGFVGLRLKRPDAGAAEPNGEAGVGDSEVGAGGEADGHREVAI
jgi:putative DNA primase/helicase